MQINKRLLGPSGLEINRKLPRTRSISRDPRWQIKRSWGDANPGPSAIFSRVPGSHNTATSFGLPGWPERSELEAGRRWEYVIFCVVRRGSRQDRRHTPV